MKNQLSDLYCLHAQAFSIFIRNWRVLKLAHWHYNKHIWFTLATQQQTEKRNMTAAILSNV